MTMTVRTLAGVMTPLLALVAIAAATTPVRTSAQQPPDVSIRAARWLDPESGALRGPVRIQVSAGRITGVAAGADADRGQPRASIDLGTATVLPGLIDAHVHLQLGGGLPRDNAAAILCAGFTTVVDLGATSDVVLRLRDRIASGALEGPRILAAGRWVGTKDGVCEFGGIGIAGGPDAFRQRVRENVDAGADVTKACVSSWLADAFARPDAYEIQDANLAAIVDVSRQAHRLVIAHAISLGSVKAAVRAGVNGLAHAALVDPTTIAALGDRGMFMIPTLASLAGDSTGPAEVALRNAVVAAHRGGVRLVFGTDGGVRCAINFSHTYPPDTYAA
jgi:imidazolonepropionase-like amidohydrolase